MLHFSTTNNPANEEKSFIWKQKVGIDAIIANFVPLRKCRISLADSYIISRSK